MKKIIFLMLFATIGLQHSLAQTFSSGGLNYDVISPTTVSVVNQNQQAIGNVTIPSQVTNFGNVYSVTSIGDYAFQSCTSLTSVAIPNSVTSIGYASFSYCTGLKSVTIPNSVTSIVDYTFYGCSGLTSVICNVATPLAITASVFDGVNQFACSLTVPSGSISAYQAAYVWQNFSPINSVNTPNISAIVALSGTGSTSVGGRAPQGSRLCNRSVYLITQSEMQASGFYAGDVITEIGFNYVAAQNIPTTSTTFGLYLENSYDYDNYKSNTWDDAIIGMTQVRYTNITIPAATGVFTIPFSSANSFTYNGGSLYVAFDYQNVGFKSTSNSVLCNTSLSGGIKTYSSTTSVGSSMSNSSFRPETCFTKGFIGSVTPTFNYVAPICSGAYLSNLPTVSNEGIYGYWYPALNNYQTTTYTFQPNAGQSTSTASMTIQVNPSTENITKVSACGSYTWGNSGQTYTTSGVYTGLSANCVTEKLDLTIIDPSANFSFEGINYVVTSPTTVAVGSNPGLSGSVTIPATVSNACGTYSVTSIGNFAFISCTNLTSVNIPNSVTNIGGFGFGFCSSLTSITIPNSVTYIGDGAFNSCTGLTSVTFPNSLTDIGQFAFSNCSGLKSITIPNSVTIIRIGAFDKCTSLTSVICNNASPLSIDASVFGGVNQGTCSLIVPAASISAYKAAAVWQNFSPIEPNIPRGLSFCAGTKVAAAVGTSALKFYSALTGGTALSGTTTLVTKTYFACELVNGIESQPRVSVAITINALPTTVATVTASDTVLCKYIGTTNTVTYTATPTLGATTYIWTVPTGVTIIDQSNNTLTVDFHTATTSGASTIGNIGVRAFNEHGCVSIIVKTISLSTTLPTAPSKLALTYNGIAQTKVGNFVGDASKALVLEATDISNTGNSYTWELPAGVSVVSGNPLTDRIITIHLGAVVAGNTNLVFKVYSVSGCGTSIARSLTVTRTAPATPKAISLTNDAISTTTKITNVSAYTGKFNTTILTLTATPNTTAGAEAKSYRWVLPSGIFVMYGYENIFLVSQDSEFSTWETDTNTLHIHLYQFGTATSKLLKVYGVNGNGQSLLSRNLTLTSAIPAKPGKLTTVSGGTATYHPTCGAITVKVPNVFGASYAWSVKDSALATISSTNTDGNEATIDVSKLPTVLKSSFKISVVASNATGFSETVYTINLGTACTSITKKIDDHKTAKVTNEFKVIAYPNPSSNVFNLKVNGADDDVVSILVFDMTGRQIENKVAKSTDIENISLGQNYSTGVYNVMVKQGENVKTVRVVKK